MLISMWHLVVAAINLAIAQMSTSLLAICASIVAPIISAIILFFKNGLSATGVNWKKKFGLSLAAICVIWGGIVLFDITHLTYDDHIAQKREVQKLSAALESTNNLFTDEAIEWNGSGDVIFVFTALRSGEDLHVYLDLRQGGGGIPGDSYVFEGQLVRQPRVEIGAISHFSIGQRLTVTLATVENVPGNQTLFQWGSRAYKNYTVGTNYNGYIGRIAVMEKNDKKEYHSYFIVEGRSFHDSKSNSTIVGPAFITGPDVLRTIKDWSAT